MPFNQPSRPQLNSGSSSYKGITEPEEGAGSASVEQESAEEHSVIVEGGEPVRVVEDFVHCELRNVGDHQEQDAEDSWQKHLQGTVGKEVVTPGEGGSVG